ncbi:TM0106 family RecB-like putative nuclease [Polymorphobacter megasporae]|uniref:TM0106 family RecB-like putative nuclease n=1 Tax=Glacieibacterium megasporae TaxID=2835787 RepID=UPI001C1DDBBB|nr:TM0106 family RecB-like putative nuclease [Polymorphobacter megasporae]UAJ10687.1 TM0106 family RecB-like putative nuclease [Polymorphobacter megasporae]
MKAVTAAQLYDHVTCPRRVDLDAHGDHATRTEISPFVRMLWRRGAAHEADVVATLPPETVRLIGLGGEDRAARTADAMMSGVDLIHGGRIAADDLLGDPDLLVRRGTGYVAADIKSGRAEEDGGDEPESRGRAKVHYAVQIALYTDVLERLGLSAGRQPEIWDVRGDRVPYDLDAPRGPRTPSSLWDLYASTRDSVRTILASPHSTRGALSAACGLCHWRELCVIELEAADDLTLIPSLGRAARDGMADVIPGVAGFAAMDPETFVVGRKTVFPGVGPDRLRLYHARATLLATPGATAYLRNPIELPTTRVEIFFDIEADPMRDLTYLHGFVERVDRDASTERFTAFYAESSTADAERRAFAAAVGYMLDRPDAAIYYYSKYERTMYRKLQTRYPDVCTVEVVEALFTPPRSIDLYCDVVMKATEWPTRNHSIKTLAKSLGFAWRDTDPSGAASIEWYHRWVETGDAAIRQRILDYNEDDCRATAVLLDGIRALR